MHDLATAEEIADAALQAAADHGGGRIVRIIARLGPTSHLDPDHLAEAFRVATAGTAAADAVLEVDKKPAVWHCRSCGAVFSSAEWPVLCPCGSADVASDDPDGVTITAIDVDDQAPVDRAE